jgi:peroxin-16
MLDYQSFVLKNAQVVGQLEGTLRHLSLVLPGRFKNSEVVSELMVVLLRLLSFYHDHILRDQVRAQFPLTKISSFNRYTKHLIKSFSYKIVAMLLKLITSSQLLIEIIAQKTRGYPGILVWIEVLK